MLITKPKKGRIKFFLTLLTLSSLTLMVNAENVLILHGKNKPYSYCSGDCPILNITVKTIEKKDTTLLNMFVQTTTVLLISMCIIFGVGYRILKNKIEREWI